MDNRLGRAYFRQRAKGLRAATALAIAKQQQRDEQFPWSESWAERDEQYHAELARDGMKIVVGVSYDEDYENDDAYGAFSDTWEPSAVNSEAFQRSLRPYGYNRRVPRRIKSRKSPRYVEYGRWHNRTQDSRYFVPNESLQEVARGYSKQGYSRHNAWLKAWEQIREEEEYTIGENLTHYVIHVTVSFRDIELASEYVGGVDVTDDDDSYLTVVAEEMIEDAVESARKNLPNVRAQLEQKLAALSALQ